MLRLALAICVLAGLIWAFGVYKLGEKTLAAHLDEIYRSPLVQHKLDALHKGFDEKLDDFAIERSQKDSTRRRVQARAEKPAPREAAPTKHAPMPPPPSAPPEPIDVRPNAGKAAKTPPRDALTDEDRNQLDKLISNKLHE